MLAAKLAGTKFTCWQLALSRVELWLGRDD
jgi:hypothetical protein